MKTRHDFYFVFSLLFILVIGFFITYDHFQKKQLNSYLRVVHDKISEMITDESDRKAFHEYYEELITHVENDSVSPQQLENLAENIISIRRQKDSLSTSDLKELLILKQNTIKKKRVSGLAEIIDKEHPDWKSLSEQLGRKIAAIDSIKNNRKHDAEAGNLLQKQLEVHETLSKDHSDRHLRIQAIVDSIKDKMTSSTLSEKDRQILLKELKALKDENNQLNSKVDALEEIQLLLDNEREKMQQKLVILDSLKNNTYKH
ncbi:MAG: hypothetical protein H6627_06900 [Calditrichae bacterium]|nr:hypothetical protein [Calditrichota bacterium]MCB9058276.1 hypothetical protein [Calditrichia bacterium]